LTFGRRRRGLGFFLGALFFAGFFLPTIPYGVVGCRYLLRCFFQGPFQPS
jgi:hypothetical protein